MKTKTLAQFITARSADIISEWEEFAATHLAAASRMDLKERRDHVEGMLRTIALDLARTQTKRVQASKSKGKEDTSSTSDTAANAHGTDRAATGFSPTDVVSEFRALRASVLRLWSETRDDFTREHLEEVTRFNEAIDQMLVESMTRYGLDVDHSKDLFLGVLGHDLRNPLGAIMMSATVMMTQEGPDWPHLKTAARILNAGTRMDGLIGDLVDFTRSRLGSGIPVTRTPGDLRMICQQTVDEMLAFHPGTAITFKASGDLEGDWDTSRIAQALSNLLGNAVQHGTDRSPIDVSLRGLTAGVVLSVHNQGKRIPHASLGDIFNPFKQLEPANAKASAGRSIGLGLYIVQAIVKAHGGTIEVESTTEAGTTFTLRLPRHAGEPEAHTPPARKRG